MAHEIENMFFVGQTPWHGLGIELKKAPTTREAIVAAGLDWEVQQQLLFLRDGRKAPAFVNVRVTDGSILGVTGPATGVLQNTEAFEFFDAFVESGEVTLETAGSLRDGKRVWILAKIARDPSVIVRGDEVQKFLLLSNSHDGKVAVRVGYTPIRVVCANTLAMAHDNEASQLLKIHHTRRVAAAVAEAREIINLADQTFEATAEQFRFLASRGVDKSTLDKYVLAVFKPRAKDEEKDKEVRDAFLKTPTYEKVATLFTSGRGNNLPNVRGTWWALYNAVTEFFGHERGKDQMIRLDNLWFGDAANTNRRALEVAVRMAQAA